MPIGSSGRWNCCSRVVSSGGVPMEESIRDGGAAWNEKRAMAGSQGRKGQRVLAGVESRREPGGSEGWRCRWWRWFAVAKAMPSVTVTRLPGPYPFQPPLTALPQILLLLNPASGAPLHALLRRPSRGHRFFLPRFAIFFTTPSRSPNPALQPRSKPLAFVF